MLRPIKQNRVLTPEEKMAKEVWLNAKRKNLVENIETKTIFNLSQKEANKCRYVIVDMNERMAECYTHKGEFSHGVKMFPPHRFDLHADGTVWCRKTTKDKWVQWFANIKENIQRLPNTT